MGILIGIWAVIVGLIDVATARIPNVAIVIGLLLVLTVLAMDGHGWHEARLVSCGIGFLLGGLIPLSGYLAGALGAGDVKFSAVLGLFLGMAGVLWMLLAAALLMGIVSLVYVLRLRVGQRAMQYRIPAGPALSLGTLFVLFDGPTAVFA